MLTKYKQLYRGWSGAGRFTGVITAVMRLGTANIKKYNFNLLTLHTII